MVCIAAFIILCVLSLGVAVLSVFRRDVGKKYWATFKKAWGCVAKKLTLRKCDTNFKEDVKNSILRKVVLKRPKLVKPISIGIEIAAVLIVLITAWSLLTAVKSGLALFVYGTCNVSDPSSCSLDASESCSIDGTEAHGLWDGFVNYWVEFGEVIAGIPARLRHWDAAEYVPEDFAHYYGGYLEGRPVALEVIDPGCLVCRDSFRNQLESGFFEKYNVALLPYTIGNHESGYKFANSKLITQYIIAAPDSAWLIIEKVFTGEDAVGREYQVAFNSSYSPEEAEAVLRGWLKEFGYKAEEIEEIAELAHSEEIENRMNSYKGIVEERIKTKKIPTVIYDGKRHSGLFKKDVSF